MVRVCGHFIGGIMNTAPVRARVLDKATGEQITHADYPLRISGPPPGETLRSIDLEVHMPIGIGIEAYRESRTLALEMVDGQFIDFFVIRVSQDGIEVTADGAPRPSL